MNRILRRPMFRIGGSSGTGITSGLDQPKAKRADFTIDDAMSEENRKLREAMAAYKRYQMSGGTMTFEQFIKMTGTGSFNTGGRVGYRQGSMPTFQAAGLPGFLTSLGLNILATPPQGNIFATTATAARDPFAQLQADQMAARRLQGEKDFLTSERLAGEKFEESQLEKKLEAQEKIAGMKDVDENVMTYAEIFSDPATNAPNIIKGQNAVNFFDFKYNELKTEYGDKSVGVEPIDATRYQTKKQINNFKKANPDYLGKIYFDVASGKAVKFVKDVESGDLKLMPVDSADIDTTGDDMPDPDKPTAGLFGQKTKPGKPLKEIIPDLRDSEFDESFYQ